MIVPVCIMTAFCLLGACGVEVHEEVGPRVPVPNVTGLVLRAGTPAVDLEARLRTLPDADVVDSTETDDDGEFAFVNVTTGEWEVKVSGEEDGDFESVTLPFQLDDEAGRLMLSALDIFAHGAQILEPSAGAELNPPTPFAPLTFRWTLPELEIDWARVQVYDDRGRPVWKSARNVTDQTPWNGVGSEGDYSGGLVPAGSYRWRVKIELPDSIEARTAYRKLVFL